MNDLPKTPLAESVAARIPVTLSAATARELDAMGEQMANEILKDPAVRNELNTLALEAIRAAWWSMQQTTERGTET